MFKDHYLFSYFISSFLFIFSQDIVYILKYIKELK